MLITYSTTEHVFTVCCWCWCRYLI